MFVTHKSQLPSRPIQNSGPWTAIGCCGVAAWAARRLICIDGSPFLRVGLATRLDKGRTSWPDLPGRSYGQTLCQEGQRKGDDKTIKSQIEYGQRFAISLFLSDPPVRKPPGVVSTGRG